MKWHLALESYVTVAPATIQVPSFTVHYADRGKVRRFAARALVRHGRKAMTVRNTTPKSRSIGKGNRYPVRGDQCSSMSGY